MTAWLSDPQAWIALGTLTALEIVLGIDNIIFIAVGVMMLSAGPVGRFVDTHPTIKILALSFLLLVGVTLVAEGMAFHIPKGYIYFAMAFSCGVEMLNLKIRRAPREPVQLRKSLPADKVA